MVYTGVVQLVERTASGQRIHDYAGDHLSAADVLRGIHLRIDQGGDLELLQQVGDHRQTRDFVVAEIGRQIQRIPAGGR